MKEEMEKDAEIKSSKGAASGTSKREEAQRFGKKEERKEANPGSLLRRLLWISRLGV
jgi:hypothetical protein